MDTFIKHFEAAPFFKKSLSANPWYIILYITSHCNQRCHMCFQHEMLNTMKRSEEWQLDEVEKLREVAEASLTKTDELQKVLAQIEALMSREESQTLSTTERQWCVV